MLIFEKRLLGQDIRCQVTRLDEGIHVLLIGGCRTHVGAVSLCRPGEKAMTQNFSGHKEQLISGPWAETLAKRTGQSVCVVCGIHYDNATPREIGEIMALSGTMLEQVAEALTHK